MLRLVGHRLREASVASTSAAQHLPALPACAACAARHAIHSSASTQWRTKEERRLALHGKLDEFRSSRAKQSRGPKNDHADREDDDNGRHYARPSYPSRRSTTAARGASRSLSEGYQRRSRDVPERFPREERPSANPYKQQVRREGPKTVFQRSSPAKNGPQYPAHFKRDSQDSSSSGLTHEQRLKMESRDKINTAYNLAKELPPLTDEDYREVYEELLTYDPAPPSPSQARLSAPGSSTTPLLGETSSKSASDRIAELLARLNRRVPEGEVPLTPVQADEGESLVSKLMRMRHGDRPSAEEDASKSLAAVLDRSAPAEPAPTAHSSTQDKSSTPLARQHARQRGKIFHALGRLLRPTPGYKAEDKKLIIGQQPKDAVKLDLATKQEWSALVLEAADDRSLTDVLTTFELMKRSGVALSEELLSAAIRLLSKDQKLMPVLLRYFEQNQIEIPASAHHEIILGLLHHSPAPTPTSRAEQYLRALEMNGTLALAKTYAAVISHIFHLRRQTGIRARAWNLYGHMRLVAHPKPSVEVFDAMIYGCSLDDRASPERALDLFTEMVELGIQPSYNTYLGLIRSCARDRSKDSPFYFEALRLLKELLENKGFKPERDIFNSILEGARSRGDIGRAKWIVANMLQLSSRDQDPRNTPLTPDHKTLQSLFLTAATYKPPNPRKQEIKLEEGQVKAEESAEADDMAAASDAHGVSEEEISTEHADTAAGFKSAGSSTPKPGDIYISSSTESDHQALHPVQHPLYQPEIPHSPHQLLDDFKQIMGTLLEVHDLPTDFLDSQPTPRATLQPVGSDPASGTDVISRREAKARHYSAGLDEGTKEALRNVSINNVLLNSYLTLLNAHGRSALAIHFFKEAFPALNVRYSHQTWEIVFSSLDTSSRQRTKELRTQAREMKASQARELYSLWEGWLRGVLRQPDHGKHSPHGWFARHVETVYAHVIGTHARAEQVDRGLEYLHEFKDRFPPYKIREAAEKEEIVPGPTYLVQLSSFLYPETMDAYVAGTDVADAATKLTGGKVIKSSLPKSQINAYNLWGLPPILSYQMIYSLFHRLREEEDDRAIEVLEVLGEYRRALKDALEIREGLERRQKSDKTLGKARREVIGTPGDRMVRPKPPSFSEMLSTPDKQGVLASAALSIPPTTHEKEVLDKARV